MKALIFGGAGFIGRSLTEELLTNGYQVCVVTRNCPKTVNNSGNNVKVIEWNNNSPLSSIKELQKIDVMLQQLDITDLIRMKR